MAEQLINQATDGQTTESKKMTNCAVVTWPNKTRTHYTNVETAGVSQTRGRASVILTAPTGERTVLDAAEVMLVGDDWLARNHSLIAGI